MTPITLAVAPLKADAIARAEKDATALVERLLTALAAADWNLDIVAPRPQARYDNRNTYLTKQRHRNLFCMVSSIDLRGRVTLLPSDPTFHKADDAKVATFIANAKEAAGMAYDAFVAKLETKVGECVSAELAGNHVWGYSVLTVTKADGTVERWKTQQIVNQSVLGLLFNQWPTRKVK